MFSDPNALAWIQAWAALASAGVTAVAAVLTGIYVIYTRRMAAAMLRQGEPVVVGRVEPFFNLYAQYVVTNVGLAPALDVEVSMTIDQSVVWRHALLEPGRSERFRLPVDGGADGERLQELKDRRKVLKASVTFSDRGGRRFPTVRTEVSFEQIMADWDSAGWLLSGSDLAQHGEQICRKLDHLVRVGESVAKSLGEQLPKMTDPTGLALSVSTIRNLARIRGSRAMPDHLSRPVRDHHVVAEVLGVNRNLAFRIWKHLAEGGDPSGLERLEGVSKDLAARIAAEFCVEE